MDRSPRFALSPSGAAALLLVLAAGTITIAAARRLNPLVPPPDVASTAHAAAGGLSVTTRLDRGAVLAGGDGLVRMELVLAAALRDGAAVRVPTDLVLVLDRSGSMGGDKIQQARRAVIELVGALGDADRFALVSYSNDARVDVALRHVGAGERDRLAAVVHGIPPSGGTNMSAGLDAALALLGDRGGGRTARVVLLSDGLANQGDSSLEGLCARGSAAARDETVLSTVGIGLDFNEVLMTRLADAGTGNFWYLRDPASLQAVLQGELRSAVATVASGLAVTLSPALSVEVVEAAGFPLERGHRGVTFRPGAMFSGQTRSTWITWRVPTGGADLVRIGDVRVTWNDGDRARELVVQDVPRVALVHRREEAVASLDKDAWEDSVVREQYQQLRQRVSQAVAAGRREEAVDAIDSFVADNEGLAAELDADRVQGTLGEAVELKKEALRALEAPAAAPERKDFVKSNWAGAQDERRAGAKPAPANK